MKSPRPGLWLSGVLTLAAAKLGLHVWTNGITPFSTHRDELLYLAMGKYLRLFHMDFPPLIALLGRLHLAVGGESLVMLRLLPAVAGTALVVLAAVIARELGGGRAAQALAGLAVLCAPLFLRAAGLFQPVVFDQLWWTLALLGLLRLGSGSGSARSNWLLLGVAGGFGLLTKFSIGFIAVGMAAAILLTPHRRWLLTRWPWTAAAIALVIGSPGLAGQLNLGFPVLGQMDDLQAVQLVHVTPLQFMGEQALLLGPGVVLAIAGVLALLLDPALRRARVVALACVATFLLLMALRGKSYYVGPIYPALLAAGAVLVERLGRRREPARSLRYAAAGVALVLAAVMLAFTALSLPIVLPVASPEATAARAERLGITAAVTTNTGDRLPLPQDFADMLGWEEQVAAVAAAYHALPAAERARAVVVAGNYGEAGAIDFFGPRYGLPRAVAPIGSYWFFGPGDLPGDVLVTLGLEPDDLDGFYGQVDIVARVANPWGVPEQQDNPIAVARQPTTTLQQAWPGLAGRN